MASLKEIRQRLGYALARAENARDEAETEAAHLRTAIADLSAYIDAPVPAPEPTPEPDPEPTAWNEPAGMTLVNVRDFSSKSVSDADRAHGWDGVESRYSDDVLRIVEDPTAPISPPPVVEMVYPAGFGGGSSPALMQLPLGGRGGRVLYHRFGLWLSPNWQGHPTTTNKVFHIWLGSLGNRLFYDASGSGSGALHFALRLQGAPDERRRFFANVGEQTGEIVRGRWRTVEVVARLNTPGEADGVYRAWMDKVLTHDYADVRFLEAGEDAAFSQVQWSPTWGGGGYEVAETQAMRLDHCYVSTL